MGGLRNCSLFQNCRTVSGVQTPSYSVRNGFSLSGGTSYNSQVVASNATIKNQSSYTSNPPTCHYVVDWDFDPE